MPRYAFYSDKFEGQKAAGIFAYEIARTLLARGFAIENVACEARGYITVESRDTDLDTLRVEQAITEARRGR